MQPRRGVSQIFIKFLWCFPQAKQDPMFKSYKIQRLEIEHFKFKDAKQDDVNQEWMIKTSPKTE